MTTFKVEQSFTVNLRIAFIGSYLLLGAREQWNGYGKLPKIVSLLLNPQYNRRLEAKKWPEIKQQFSILT
jgi:hypothetical protein